jgi:rifampicin phosphotransferase
MIVRADSTDAFARREAGGKGYNLYLMSGQGLPVPPWVVVGRGVYNRFVEETGIHAALRESLDAFGSGEADAATTADRMRACLTAPEMPVSIGTLVAEAYGAVTGSEGTPISVRSSAADEDSAAHSFAGQLSSYLYVDRLDDALARVRDCWISNFSARALSYRKENGLATDAMAVAVILQRMIDPDASGVLFTCDPADDTSDAFVVSAVYGVGEGLVSGALDADTYWLDRASGAEIKRVIVPKVEAFRRGTGGGDCRRVPVDTARREVPCLTPPMLRDLHRLGVAAMTFYGRPQDIEWAVADGRLHVLQSRAVTTVTRQRGGYLNLWDNSNIVESYGGLTSPLSFTFALHNYKGVYVQFCEILHVPALVVREMEPCLGAMLGCINGRVYYNLYNWYKLVGVLPGFRRNRQFMETMMGVGEELSPEVADRIEPHPSWKTPVGKLRRLVTGLSFLVYHFRIQSLVNRFLADFRKAYEDFRHRDYRRMNSDAILNAYSEMDRRMLNHWKAPIINDFLCMIHFGLYKKLGDAWLAHLDGSILNDLLAGGGEIESAEPTRVLIRMAGRVAADPALRTLIESTAPEDLLEALNQSPHRTFYAEVQDYIDRFGFRCMSEMKLEETDLYTDPSFLFVCLKNYLRAGTTDLDAYERRKTTLRREAETRAQDALKGFRRIIFFHWLRLARKAIRNRENTRFARTRVYGVARSMFQAMGDDLAAHSILAAPRDIFYLTLDELFGLHRGTLTNYDLKSLVALRRQAYAAFESEEPEKRFTTRGPVYWHNDFARRDAAPDVPADADYDLRGMPCCPGVIEGVVKVVHSSGDNLELNGEILVTSRTDPGWVPLYPSVSGLLVERGSLLSHSAIVAREMGLPAIVAIPGLIATLKTGQRIRMNGAEGTIKILPPA